MENSCDNKCDPIKHSVKDNQVSQIYPIVLGSAETSISVDTECTNSICEDWEEELAVQSNTAVPQGATINVENSSDVVIGPLTQFHGPVTIFQNINSENQTAPESYGVQFKSDINLNNKPDKPFQIDDNTPSNTEKRNRISKLTLPFLYKRLLISTIAAIAMLALVSVSVVLSLNMTSNTNETATDELSDDSTDRYPSNGSHQIYTRSKWGGRPQLNNTRPLRHPTEYVLISHTAGSFCNNLGTCAPIMQSIQSLHVSEYNSPDIGYNFLIGGDANIYVGRGWDLINFHDNNNIAVSFIGNYVYDELTPGMTSALKYLLGLGVKLKKLPPDYKLICHNQTFATISPGKNVYKEIVKFSNFYDGPINFDDDN